MFGVQWNLVLKYLETKGTLQSALNSNSTEWGNYYKNTYNITNTSAKYYNGSWLSAPYEKTSSESIVLTTGASSEFSKQNISDLAGNVEEWTLEYTSDAMYACATVGGYYALSTNTYVRANYREYYRSNQAFYSGGFRVSLY